MYSFLKLNIMIYIYKLTDTIGLGPFNKSYNVC